MSLVEALLVIGTFGICTGVWVTLVVIMNQSKECDCVRTETLFCSSCGTSATVTKGDKDAS